MRAVPAPTTIRRTQPLSLGGPLQRGGKIEVRNFSQFSAISQFFAIFRNFSQFSAIFRNFPAIFPQFFAIEFDPPRPQFFPPSDLCGPLPRLPPAPALRMRPGMPPGWPRWEPAFAHDLVQWVGALVWQLGLG